MNNSIRINRFNNGYGIKELKVNVNGGTNILKNVSIYASNGIFKTSFSKTFHDLCLNPSVIKDRLTNESFSYEILIGDKDFSNRDVPIIVFSRDILDSIYFSSLSKELSSLTTNKEFAVSSTIIENQLNNLYDTIINIINSLKIDDKLIFQILNCTKDNKIIFLKNIVTELKKCYITENIDKINVNVLKSKAGETLDNVEFKNELKSYNDYLDKKLLSKFFDEKMNETSIESFIKALESIEFINESKGRYIVVNNIEYKNLDDFKKIVSAETKLICAEPEMLLKMHNIEKMLGGSGLAKQIKKELQEDVIMRDLYSNGRKQLIISKIKEKISFNIDESLNDIVNIEENINNLIKEAESAQSKFDYAIKIFKERFNSIFDIKILNKGIACIGKDAPQIAFFHNRAKENQIDENKLKEILSSGEKTALNIIKFIVEYENEKEKNPIIILDDIIETFDYANRYAFIRYINEMMNEGANIILLTHNYEFYRNIKLRAGLESLVATCNDKLKVTIEKNSNINFEASVFSNISNVEQLYYALPFSREIGNYTGIASDNYLPFLHYTKQTDEKTIGNLVREVKKVFPNISVDKNVSSKYFDSIIKYCDEKISSYHDSFELKFKIILAISIRLLIEKLIVGNNFYLLKDISENQTNALYEKYKLNLTDEFIPLIEEALIMTPEYIHMNAFMYEPLIDIIPRDLVNLFKKLRDFDPYKVWKQDEEGVYFYYIFEDKLDEEIEKTEEKQLVKVI